MKTRVVLREGLSVPSHPQMSQYKSQRSTYIVTLPHPCVEHNHPDKSPSDRSPWGGTKSHSRCLRLILSHLFPNPHHPLEIIPATSLSVSDVSLAVSDDPDSAAKRLQQNPWQTYFHIRTHTSSARIGTCAWSNPSGCQHPWRSPTWWQAGMETSTRSSTTNLDPPAGCRRRARCWCCLGRGQWSRRLGGATTRRRSSGPLSEWAS